MTKSAQVLLLSALALSGVLAQPSPPAARVTVIRIPNPAVQKPDSANAAHWLYRVRPATIVLDRNVQKMFVTNFTDLEMSIDLPDDFPADGKPSAPANPANSNRKRSIIKFKDLNAEKIDGAFAYEVTLKDAAGNAYQADGESSPRVIIDP
jgi:hypothetical protein